MTSVAGPARPFQVHWEAISIYGLTFPPLDLQRGLPGWDFDKACRHIRETGYSGIEIAPFTLSEDPVTIPAAERKQYADIIAGEGLLFVGLHWLMVAPKDCT